MRTIKIALSTIKAALKRAEVVSDDWQAQCCEIALIPAVARRYAELNADQLRSVSVQRHAGQPHKGYSPEDNAKVQDWTQFAGYTLTYGTSGYGWNSVSNRGYSHSPSTCWNGMRRETVSQFIHDLRMLALGYTHPEILNSIQRAGIKVTGLSS